MQFEKGIWLNPVNPRKEENPALHCSRPKNSFKKSRKAHFLCLHLQFSVLNSYFRDLDVYALAEAAENPEVRRWKSDRTSTRNKSPKKFPFTNPLQNVPTMPNIREKLASGKEKLSTKLKTGKEKIRAGGQKLKLKVWWARRWWWLWWRLLWWWKVWWWRWFATNKQTMRVGGKMFASCVASV